MSNRPTAPAKIEYNQQFVLRPVEPADIPKIENALHDSLEDLRVYMSWAHHLQNRPQFIDRVVTQWWNYFRGDEYEMALFDKNSGEFLVYSGFYPTVRINPNSFEIGFWTSSKQKGKGFATLATQMQIILIFEYFKGDRIEITSNIKNQASLRVIEKCGFHYEGELRNFYPRGTVQMFEQGYTRERRVSLHSLIREDRPSLSWYPKIMEKLTLFPILDPPVRFDTLRL
jgi:RimJ/RimL family protein N-acetyltransferase